MELRTRDHQLSLACGGVRKRCARLMPSRQIFQGFAAFMLDAVKARIFIANRPPFHSSCLREAWMETQGNAT
jgi:hypothetical protein